MVAGELHKPEIFTDKEGKPQVSMEITASFIQFSPFGKPGGSSQGDGQPQQVHAQVPGGAAPSGFSATASPYMPGSMTAPKGNTIDDEVPF